ncbi:cysteine hydrolase family protein [Desulfocurvibacter africanus]|uniref:Isochorismatase hydrolase n=1 Tax=Desulfocurvibacter africanus subsp. africanus str. Walvis Bay TaxID=690850 RepID=F3YYI3_DESAF|nr:isochorismatase family protein [Desulfocurvibacter africanus]EGJ50737.1 isochorismatase hydrolase [Desulfocurvibacter africanus subsp. africanus str. Walvis Bay]
MTHYRLLLPALIVVTALALMSSVPLADAQNADTGLERSVIELWNTCTVPRPPELKPVELDPKTTAYLVLDIEELTCNESSRPRCLKAVPGIAAFLAKARAAKMPVVYSLTRRGTPETILSPVKPRPDEPVVQASVDKFVGTDLEKILREKGVKTVVVTGTAANGAVLHTAVGAAIRGFDVIVPVDGMPGTTLYEEQYTAYHIVAAPGVRDRSLLTRFGLMTIK